MKKKVLLGLSFLLGAFTMVSCSQDDEMDVVNTATEQKTTTTDEQMPEEFTTLKTQLSAFSAETNVDVTPLREAAIAFASAESSNTTSDIDQQVKQDVGEMLNSIADKIEGQHSFSHTFGADTTAYMAVINLWRNILITDNSFALAGNKSISIQVRQNADTAYVVKLSVARDANIGTNTADATVKYDVEVSRNNQQIVAVSFTKNIDVSYSLSAMTVSHLHNDQIVIDYNGMTIKATGEFSHGNPSVFSVVITKDGSQLADMQFTQSLLKMDATIDVMDKATIGASITNTLQFALQVFQLYKGKVATGTTEEQCKTFTESFNKNADITISLSGTAFAKIHTAIRTNPDSTYKAVATCYLIAIPSMEYTVDELSSLLGFDLMEIIKNAIAGKDSTDEATL